MKKTLLALILFLTILLGFPIGRLFALETVYLTPEFIDNATYNLETGAYIPLNTSWACTNRETVPVGTAVVTVNNLLAHHVLFFTETNGYIGYGNLIASYEGGTRFIANYADSSIELPANTAKVAFTVNKTGSAVPSGLGAYTYEDIFDSPTYLTYDDAVLGDTLGDVFTNGSYLNYTDDDFGPVTLDEAFNAEPFVIEELDGMRLIETEWPNAGSGLATGWNKLGIDMTPSIVGTTQRADWSSDQTYGYLYHQMSFSEGHIYYAEVLFTDGTTGGTQFIEMRNGTSRIPFMTDMTTGVNYGTATALWSAAAYIRFYNDGPRSGDYVVYDSFYLFDLTALFGAGNELSGEAFYRCLHAGVISVETVATNHGYSRATINAQASEFTSEGITVLSLTNLIQTGQFSSDTVWVKFNAVIEDGVAKLTSVAGVNAAVYQNGILTIGGTYYTRFSVTYNNGAGVVVNETFIGNPIFNAIGTYSLIDTADATYYQIKRSNTTVTWVDNIFVFASSTYTKTQIDTALSYFGYLTYNEAYSLPDTTDGDFAGGYYIGGANLGAGLYLYDLGDRYNEGAISAQTSSAFDTWLSKWGVGENALTDQNVTAYNPTGLIFAGAHVSTWDDEQIAYYKQLYLDANNEVRRYEFFTQYGITAGNYAYYTDLYADATAQTERYEWYTWAGVTAGNYTALRATYDFYEDYYGTNYSLAEFDNLVASYDREEIVPIEDLTVVEKIEDWFENTLGLAEFAEFFYFIISLVLVVIIVIVLAVFHAPSIIILVVGGLTLVLFIAIGWFPFWLALLLTIGLIALFVFKKPSGGNA